MKNHLKRSGMAIALIIVFLQPFKAQNSILEQVDLLDSPLTSAQTDRLSHLNSLGKFSKITCVKVKLDSTTVDSSGYFYCRVPSVLSRTNKFFLKRFTVLDSLTSIDDSSSFYLFGEEAYEATSDYCTFSLLRYGDHRYMGQLSTKDRDFEIFDLTGGVQVLCEYDRSRDHGFIDPTQPGKGFEAAQTVQQTTCEDRTIKILFFYTPAAASKLNNDPIDMLGKCFLSVEDLNTIAENSWLGPNPHMQYEFGGMEAIAFTENLSTGNSDAELDAYINTTGIAALKALHEAEVAVFFTDSYTNFYGAARNIPASGLNDAIALVDVLEATSNRHTFAHEVCHLMGCQHDNATSGFNRGYTATWNSVTYRSLVTNNAPRIPYISNPFIFAPGYFMTGDFFHQNYNMAFAFLAPIIATFYPDTDPEIILNRQSCTNNWTAELTKFCPSPDQGPYSYTWRGISFIQVLGALFGMPYSLAPLGTGNNITINVPSPLYFVLVDVANASSVIEASEAKLVYGFNTAGAWGNCFGYRSTPPLPGENSISGDDNILLYPNPSAGQFKVNIQNGKDKAYDMTLYNLVGEKVSETKHVSPDANTYEADLRINESLSNGVYFLKISSGSQTFVKRIVLSN